MERGSGENTNRWFKFGDVRTQDGRLYSRQIVARIDVTPVPLRKGLSNGSKPRLVDIEELKTLLAGGPPIVRRTEGQRPREDLRIEIGTGENQWTKAEIAHIISEYDELEEEPKPRRGRPPKEEKDAESTGSGDGPAATRAAGSKGDES
jgi:hypothetical protein